MLNKVTILQILLVMNMVPVRANMEVKNTAIAVTAAVIGTGTVMYLICRESNASKIGRSQTLITACHRKVDNYLLQIRSKEDIDQLIDSTNVHALGEFKYSYQCVQASKQELKARYSWLTPWNWSEDMKKAVYDITVLHAKLHCLVTLLKYAKIFQNRNNDKNLIRAARVVGGMSHYPIKDVVNMLNYDLDFLKKMSLGGTYESVIEDLLIAVRSSLLASDEYSAECRAYEKYLLESKKIAALENQANAQRAQADAQMRQALAQEAANKKNEK